MSLITKSVGRNEIDLSDIDFDINSSSVHKTGLSGLSDIDFDINSSGINNLDLSDIDFSIEKSEDEERQDKISQIMETKKLDINMKRKQQKLEEEALERSKLRIPFIEDIMPKCGDTKLNICLKYFVMLCYILFCYSSVRVLNYYAEQFINERTQRQMRHLYTVESQYKDMNIPMLSDIQTVIRQYSQQELKPLVVTESAQQLLNINSDVVGYIKIEGTNIDGPVVQGEDNDYYLNHSIYGSSNQAGTLFVDSRATIGTYYDSPNLIIYGHNQKDGSMFGDMDFYRWNIEYWKQKPVIMFNTNYESNYYLIIASFVTNELPEHDNGYVFDYWNYINFTDDFPFDKWKQEVLDRTTFYTGYDFDEYDEYITLSTCSTEWEPSRHVIIARKLRSDEDAFNIDTSMWEKNENNRMPQIWYDYNGGGSWSSGRDE